MSTFKYLAALLPHSAYGNSAGGALSTAAGFLETDIGDGSVERFWKTGAVASTSFEIAIDVGSAVWDSIAVFDMRATDGTLPSSVKVAVSNVSLAAGWGAGEALSMNARGGGWLAPTFTTRRYVKLTVAFGSAKTLRIGEVGVGTAVALTRQHTDRSDTHDHRLIENESRAGSVFRARAGAERNVISLAWAELIKAERDELEAMWTAADGGLEPLVIIPDSYRPTEVYHGYLPPTWSESISDPLWTTIEFAFVESGRGA